jgi:CRISPR-associated endonuclease/helicase Cas3
MARDKGSVRKLGKFGRRPHVPGTFLSSSSLSDARRSSTLTHGFEKGGHVIEFPSWFRLATNHVAPLPWQEALALDPICRDRMLRIPTGFGKTAGVAAAWLWNRVVRQDDAWPRRLVYCLPMRTLIEQLERELQELVTRTKLEVSVHVPMDIAGTEPWILELDQPRILIGAQDVLLSRALNRGYATAPAQWPIEFGLLHQDALWVLDEVQLMDVGLATSVSLAGLRKDIERKGVSLRPTNTWWISPTLQPHRLAILGHPDPHEPSLCIQREHRQGLFKIRKPIIRREDLHSVKAIAEYTRAHHSPGTLTLVVLNQVQRALDTYDALQRLFCKKGKRKRSHGAGAPDLHLVHSRFRGAEKAAWVADFLCRRAPIPEAGRIVVATQVIEAGADISARLLITEIASWSSLVQRFGRVARYEGDTGKIVVIGRKVLGEDEAAPYRPALLAASEGAIAHLLCREGDGSLRSLETLEEELSKNPALFGQLSPDGPLPVLHARDLHDLFDTSVEDGERDLDISRLVGSALTRDVYVFWRTLPADVQEFGLDSPPERLELCPVPIEDLQKWRRSAYVFHPIRGKWLRQSVDQIGAGMVVLLNALDGGYSLERGWDMKANTVQPIPFVRKEPSGRVSLLSEEDESNSLSVGGKLVATHAERAETEAFELGMRLGVPRRLCQIVALAARWHDAGKAHPAFQAAEGHGFCTDAQIDGRRDLAGVQIDAQHEPPRGDRPGFRHELASTLILFELLRRHDPMHPALLGRHRLLLEALGDFATPLEEKLQHPLAAELAAFSAEEFDLLAWLVCSHHGKVRCSFASTLEDQVEGHGGVHGICEGDRIPSFRLLTTGSALEIPPLTLSLSLSEIGLGVRYGASWSERVAGLLERMGPFTLSYLEALLRVADRRASGRPVGVVAS